MCEKCDKMWDQVQGKKKRYYKAIEDYRIQSRQLCKDKEGHAKPDDGDF